MLERMGCKGRIIALYAQSQPSMDAVRIEKERGAKGRDKRENKRLGCVRSKLRSAAVYAVFSAREPDDQTRPPGAP